MGLHNQVAAVVEQICATFGLEGLSSEWDTPPRVVKNDQLENPLDYQIQIVGQSGPEGCREG